MNRALKLLAAMKCSPHKDWTAEDVIDVCRNHGIRCLTPPRGAHFVLSHHLVDGLLTVPARRPLKPFHTMLLVELVEAVIEGKRWYAATKSSFSF
jgi:hypothetical protein